MSTVSLQMIVKDEFDNVAKIVHDAILCFDEINLTVSDKTTANKISKLFKDKDMVNVKWRAWNNRFDEARNENVKMSTTDYYFWIDADDHFDFTKIPDIVAFADARDLDQVYLPYNYAQDEQGNCVAFHWRERLIRRSHPFVWKGWVHETPVTDQPFNAQRYQAVVTHLAGPDHVQESVKRNHAILEEAVKESDDPRYKLYLGTSYHANKDYQRCLEILDEYLAVSGFEDDIYRALCLMSECGYLLKNPQLAMEYALKAAGLSPSYPQAYWLLAQWESEEGNWEQALEWVNVSETKKDQDTLSVVDPTARHRARLIAAQAAFMLKDFNAALEWLRKVPENNEHRQELEEGFLNEADAETFIKLLPKFVKYFKSDKVVWEGLAPDLQFDVRLRGLRERVTSPATYKANHVAILCGQGHEEWGPHTLDQGMGGSEEAVIYLSRELVKLGYDVTVYGAVEEEIYDGKVQYLPWRWFDRRDKFNVFVAWRAPDFTEPVNAKIKLIDVHDILPGKQVQHYSDATYMFKSNYHRNLYPHLPEKAARVIGNGIVKEQFKGDEK